MMTDARLTQPPVSDENLTASRLIRAGLLAAIVASIANLLVYYLVPALFGFTLAFPMTGPGSAIEPLPAFMVVVAMVVATIGGAALLAFLNRFSTRPVTLFRAIAVAFLLLSFAAPLTLAAPLSVRLTLATMHIVAAAIITYVLTR